MIEHGGDHPGGRRLAMGTGDRDTLPTQHEGSQSGRAVPDAQAETIGLHQLRIVRTDRRGDHDRASSGQMGRVMAHPGLDPSSCQITQVG